MDEKHKADEIVHLNDLSLTMRRRNFRVSGTMIRPAPESKSRETILRNGDICFNHPSWSIYVEYSENGVGVACFCMLFSLLLRKKTTIHTHKTDDKEYENAVKCYVKFAEERRTKT